MADIQTLSQVPLFEDLTEEDLEEIRAFCQEVQTQPGEVLLTSGEQDDSIYFIIRGEVTITVVDDDQVPTMVSVIPRRAVVGWSALIPPYLSTATAKTVTNSLLLRIDGKCLREFCSSHSRAGFLIMQGVGKVVSVRLANTRHRFADLLRKEPTNNLT